MSRAFVKEQDDAVVEVPERPISTHRNLVTATGLAAIEAELESLRSQIAEASGVDRKAAVATLSRDLRYWTARRASAELTELEPGEEVRFGSTVTVERADGRRQTFQIVGEDEADPAAGSLSYVAPLARALTGKSKGDSFAFMEDTIEIVEVA